MDATTKFFLLCAYPGLAFDDWVTIKGAHVETDEGGNLKGAAGQKIASSRTKKQSIVNQTQHKNYQIGRARYAKGMNVINTPSKDGYKSPEARLADAVANGRFSGREGGYIMSDTQKDFFEKLVKHGARADYFTRDIEVDGQKMSVKEAKKYLSGKK